MGFFEWFGEMMRPGPVGRISRRNEEESWQPRSKFLVWLLTVLGTALLVFFTWSLARSEDWWKWLIALFVYLFIAYYTSPQPDHSNMGWFGGLIDNPFRFSDDLNRFAAFLALLLLPGKLIVYALQTILNTIQVFRSKS
jgi:hypothetical protein